MVIEIRAPQIDIVLLAGEELIDNDQERVGHRDRRGLPASSHGNPTKLGSEIGIFSVPGAVSSLDESNSQPRITLPSLSSVALAGTLVIGRRTSPPTTPGAQRWGTGPDQHPPPQQ